MTVDKTVMGTVRSLGDIEPPFVRGSDTSEAAAQSMMHTVGQLRTRVHRVIESSPCGMTCDEVEVALKLRHQTASARVRELAIMGRIRDSGRRRKTRSGRSAVVWEYVLLSEGVDYGPRPEGFHG
jgi:hypothetical protein